MWALKLFRDDFCRPDVNKGPRRHRHKDGVRQLPRELRDHDTEGQPFLDGKERSMGGRRQGGAMRRTKRGTRIRTSYTARTAQWDRPTQGSV